MISASESRAEYLAKVKGRYVKSQAMLERAMVRIPIGSQTFSKSHLQYPKNAAPHFLDRGQGSRVWDIDGNEYVDLVNGLLPVILGYTDPDVDEAVSKQLKKGISFSLATPLEIELAEKVAEIIPCGEMCRFFKNGTDATSAAVRVARAATGRDHIAVCGYHGWQDWYIGSTARSKGVPNAVREMTHVWNYNDLSSLQSLFDKFPNQIAAVIMEPMNVADPNAGFLQSVADLTQKNGALFVFDEIITGFRFDLKGAQMLFGVTPDLASFGKSMANGFAISMLAGKKEFMKELEEVFLSGTFGGEALSLTAALATIKKMEEAPVHQHLINQGSKLTKNLDGIISKHGLGDVLGTCGHPTWSFITFKDHEKATLWEIKSLYLQEMLARGVLTLGSHNLSFSHTDEDLELIAAAQEASIRTVAEALDSGSLRSYLVGEPIEPLFKVR